MGKKSKKRSSDTRGPSREEDPLVALQELQSHVNSLSLAEAMRAVKAATASLNHLKEQQQQAIEDTQRAKREVLSSTLKKESNDLYGQEEFWNKRYKDQSIYEWYLPFESLKDHIFPDLNACSNLRGEILVAGCGNSTLCEDLWHSGYRLICGLDYSADVINLMAERAKSMSTVRYLEADACALPTSMNNFRCRAIIDKGTLDAIASGGKTDPAFRYLAEMWRVLLPVGRFLIVSTMPPDLFNLLATSIVGSRKYLAKHLKTPEGGDVYYYSLEKMEVSVPTNSPIPSDLESLLTEAVRAQEELEELQKKTMRQKAIRDLAERELEEAEKTRHDLSETLSGHWQLMSDSLPKEISTNSDRSIPTSFPSPQVPPNVRIPKVFMSILSDQSNLASSGHVSVEYLLSDGEWDEDDFVSLHDMSPDPSSEPLSFEYTTSPELCTDKKSVRGTVQLSLPFYGGSFCLRYQRVDVTIVPTTAAVTTDQNFEDPPEEQDQKAQNALVYRENICLFESSPFLVNFSVQDGKRLCRANNGRGFSQLGTPSNIMWFIEDLTNINALMVTLFSPGSKLMKPACWIEKDKQYRLVVECNRSGDIPPSKCEWISIPLHSKSWEYSWKDSYGTFEDILETPSGSNRLLIKIPYSSSAVEYFTLKSSVTCSSHSGLRCRSCDSMILSSSSITSIQPLPSGLFDQVMHEYLCSETQPTMPLSMSEYTTPSGRISLGAIFFSLHPSDISSESHLQYKCKLTPSLFDVLGGSFGMKLLPQLGLSECSATLSLVDASTCSVTCSRCLAMLGDGLIASDSGSHEPTVDEIWISDLQDIRFLRSSVKWSPCGLEEGWGDKELVKLLLEPCAVEQVLANTFLWLVNRYDVTSFEVAVPDWTDPGRVSLRVRLLSRSQREVDDQQIRRLQSGYSVCEGPSLDTQTLMRPAIKVSWRSNSPAEESKTKASRAVVVPVSFSEFFEIKSLLEVRSQYFGPSFLPNERISFMLQ